MSDQQGQPQSATAGTEQASSMELAYRAPTRHERLDNFGKNWKSHAKTFNEAHHKRHARAHFNLAEHHLRKANTHERRMDHYTAMADRHGKNHPKYHEWKAKAKEHAKLWGQHDKLSMQHREWSTRHSNHIGSPAIGKSKGRSKIVRKARVHASLIETAGKMPTKHEHLENFGKDWKSHAKIADPKHHKQHAKAHYALADYHHMEATKAHDKAEVYGGKADNHLFKYEDAKDAEDKKAAQAHKQKEQEYNKLNRAHIKLEAHHSGLAEHHEAWGDRHRDKTGTHASVEELAATKPEFGKDWQKHQQIKDPDYHRLQAAKHQKAAEKADDRGDAKAKAHHYKWYEKHREHYYRNIKGEEDASMIETAAHPHMRHFGQNAKFHATIRDPKHHLDHAHEHLAAAKSHHEQILSSSHPNEVLHHTKQRNHHAKWAEAHIGHFHSLEGSHSPTEHSSVEETAAKNKGPAFGKDWSEHAKHDDWGHHMRHRDQHKAAALKEKDPAKKAIHEQWANAHDHKAAKLDPFLETVGRGRIKKPKADIASVATVAQPVV